MSYYCDRCSRTVESENHVCANVPDYIAQESVRSRQVADVNATIKRLTRERDEAVARWNATAGASQRDLDAALVEQRRYSLALAASQAECAALREALARLRGAAFGLLEATSDMTCEHDPHANTVCPHGHARSRVQSMCRAAQLALSRPPGSREALLSYLNRCGISAWDAGVGVADDASAYAQMSSRDLDEQRDIDVAAIVARLLPEGGSHE